MPVRILIIEDNPTNMELMAYLLRAYGYNVLSAYDGVSGIQMARATLPALIVCDIHLPKMDGYEVLRQLKSASALQGVPVVAVTALAMVGDREKLLNAGFDGYISKPIDPESFVDKVSQFLPAILREPNVNESRHEAHLPDAQAPSCCATILVVDDSPVNRELIRSTLEPFGYTLLMANGVKEGMQRAHEDTFDIILSDVHMPNEDGFNFIRRIRSDPRLAKVPFLFLTATSGHFDDGSKAIALGASGYLKRPLEPQQLIDEIECCLNEASKVKVCRQF